MEEIVIQGSILQSIRSMVGLDVLDNSFDTELTMHINSALATLNQNGVGLIVSVTGHETAWDDFKDPLQIDGNEMFESVKTYVALKTKVLFDPPPPSSVSYFIASIDELLWRLNLAYAVKEVNNIE